VEFLHLEPLLTVEKTLCRLRGQLFRFRKLLDVISGVVFVGTPHLNRSDDDTWQRLATIFRVHLKNVTKKTLPKEDLSRLSLSAQRFEGLALSIPILSGFETQETRLRGGIWTKKAAIVRSVLLQLYILEILLICSAR
jgi:hypothetical protein